MSKCDKILMQKCLTANICALECFLDNFEAEIQVQFALRFQHFLSSIFVSKQEECIHFDIFCTKALFKMCDIFCQ